MIRPSSRSGSVAYLAGLLVVVPSSPATIGAVLGTVLGWWGVAVGLGVGLLNGWLYGQWWIERRARG